MLSEAQFAVGAAQPKGTARLRTRFGRGVSAPEPDSPSSTHTLDTSAGAWTESAHPGGEPDVAPCLLFVSSELRQRGVKLSEPQQKALKELMRLMAVEASPRCPRDPGLDWEVTVSSPSDQEVLISVINRGLPLLSKSFLPDSVSKELPQLHYKNLGRHGQSFSIGFRTNTDDPQTAQTESSQRSGATAEPSEPSAELLPVREIQEGDFEALTQLFHKVYEYRYVNEAVYHPDRLRKMVFDKRLISLVAPLANGRLAAHLGMIRLGEKPHVYEMGFGLTDPDINSRGVFSTLLQELMEQANRIDMAYLVFDYVTNHDLTQRVVSRYGSCDMALCVGSQLSDTQAKLAALNIGTDSQEMDRYSILIGVKTQVDSPFGRTIHLPIALGEMLGFLIEPLGMEWLPTPRFCPLDESGSFHHSKDSFQRTASYELTRPGVRAIRKIIQDWRHALRLGYQYCSVDIPLDAPGVGQAYDRLANAGFFVSGFVPLRFSGRLALRLQATGPKRLAFHHIKIASEIGRRLLQVVHDSHERNVLL